MQRATTITVGLSFIVAVALLGLLTRSPAKKPDKPAAAAKAEPAATASAAASANPSGDLADFMPEPPSGEVGFDTLLDGRKAPPLPDTAPPLVRFGVILFRYQGAQSAPRDARSKEQAKQKAIAIVADAKRDFAAAVAKGDPGSTADAGRIPRGMLEPAAEYVLFTLPKGEVSPEPVDTPKGFWVVRRSE